MRKPLDQLMIGCRGMFWSTISSVRVVVAVMEEVTRMKTVLMVPLHQRFQQNTLLSRKLIYLDF